MRLNVAVIGPDDLVEEVCKMQPEFESLFLAKWPYESETEAVELAARAQGASDVLVFTGPVPYYLAKEELEEQKPWFYMSLRGTGLLRALLKLAQAKANILTVSVDTLSKAVISEVYEEVGMDSGGVYARDYKGPIKSEDLVRFHADLYREGKTTYAVTCLRSTYLALQEMGIPVIRVTPTRSTIRGTLRLCVEAGESARNKASQVAMGILRVDTYQGSGDLVPHVEVNRLRLAVYQRLLALGQEMQASVLFLGGDEFAVIATRGALEESTQYFQGTPILSEIACELNLKASMGWGLGLTAAQAEHNARQSLRLAEQKGGGCCYILFENQRLLGPIGAKGKSLDYSLRVDEEIVELARKIGLGAATLGKLKSLVSSLGRTQLTASDVAQGFDVSLRSARRILCQLEKAGAAQVVGEENPAGRGRPRQVYDILLK